ncbi:shikimate 5-dehydrogenase [Sphaerisporangium melleum]|uniref:Shikimate 5-dehydrogenase n=1 Tax=Sphaerisporangium melleum TaxID=321316 RepID=A0A917VID6_9ACTN|nr:shikimate dehydrogenase [Sphaerisporangium melleum]GGK87035.1 shikimate 5-dehydrogenase [Sphaerisporangium melleum]GII72348.1 shikimate 5-dehydrogenase [Sphaerisporangium melleum]
MERRAAVLGSPIAHSLSPALHRAAYRALGLRGWRYDAIECGEEGLAGLLAGLGPEWAGLSLTMPLKRVVFPLLDTVADLAVQVGAVNTVIFRDGARHGENTDVYGMVRALAEAGVTAPRAAVVLGGGATAGSALAALRELGLREATLVVREAARARETAEAAERLGMTLTVRGFGELATALEADLAISTLPSGAADAHAGALAAVPAVFDVVYAPWPTPLARAVRDKGGTVIGGLSMLLHQAIRQVELYTGRSPVPVEPVRAAGEAEILARAAG